MIKSTVALLLLSCCVSAECIYRVDAALTPSKNTLHVTAAIQDSDPILLKDIGKFPVENSEALIEKMQLGSRALTFSYSLTDETAINEDFIMLLENWLPTADALCRFESTVTLPEGYEAITEHDYMRKEAVAGKARFTFSMQNPIDHLSLIASKAYEPRRIEYNGITINTYFFTKDVHLSERYFEKTKAYIAMYEAMIGPYPYKSFSIVENRHQTGYSMPTFTLIGDRLIDKPYLIDRSLGHEIVHQWFGNGVFNDFATGNWVEGLATYLSDHHLKTLKMSDLVYRKQTLDTFMNAVTPEKDFSLITFHHRFDRASMSIGYGKGMFLFHMLRKEMGEEAFYEALRAFYSRFRSHYADYNDIVTLFSKHAGRDLKPFFFQWLYAKGLLDLRIDDLSYDSEKGMVKFRIVQQKRRRSFDVPLEVTLECSDKSVHREVRMDKLEQRFELSSDCRPKRIILDEQYALLRSLGDEEKLLTIGTLEQLEGFNIIGADQEDQALLQTLFKHAHFVNSDKEIGKDNPHRNSVYVNAAKSLPGVYKEMFDTHEGDMTLQTIRDARNGGAIVLLEYPKGELASLAARLKYYSSYSKIAIKGHKSLFKRLCATQNGIAATLP